VAVMPGAAPEHSQGNGNQSGADKGGGQHSEGAHKHTHFAHDVEVSRHNATIGSLRSNLSRKSKGYTIPWSGMFLCWLAAGMVLYSNLLPNSDGSTPLWSRTVTCAYFVTQIFTSVGYGDFAVRDDVTRFGIALHLLVGVVVVVNCVADLVPEIVRGHQRRKLQRMPGIKLDGEDHLHDAVLNSTRAFAWFLACIPLGTVGFFLLEHVSWTEAFYWAVVTMTTVGFGDCTPKTAPGQLFAGVYMVLGVVQLYRLALAVAEHKVWGSSEHTTKKLTVKLLDEMDANHDGQVTSEEFLRFILISQGLVTKETLDRIDQNFKVLDVDDSGSLTHGDLTAWLETSAQAKQRKSFQKKKSTNALSEGGSFSEGGRASNLAAIGKVFQFKMLAKRKASETKSSKRAASDMEWWQREGSSAQRLFDPLEERLLLGDRAVPTWLSESMGLLKESPA